MLARNARLIFARKYTSIPALEETPEAPPHPRYCQASNYRMPLPDRSL